MAISLYKIAEKARIVLEKRVSLQVLVSDVASAYATIARQRWFENTQFDEQEIDGAFITTFKNLEPTLDLDVDQYYIMIPSTFLSLPHQAGIKWVANMKDSKSWVRIDNWGLLSGIKAGLMGGRQVYTVEGNRMYFPKMRKDDSECKIILKLAIALDNVDPYDELNIPSDMEDAIVKEVVGIYVQKANPIEKIRETIN